MAPAIERFEGQHAQPWRISHAINRFGRGQISTAGGRAFVSRLSLVPCFLELIVQRKQCVAHISVVPVERRNDISFR